MPEVTVLTAAHNGGIWIEDTVESIRRQCFQDWEYIIVDDGSIDDTPRILQHLAERDPRIRVFRRETPGGPYKAANHGLRYATGEFVICTDQDDLSLPHRIGSQVSFLKENGHQACTSFVRPVVDDRIRMANWYPPPRTPGVLKWILCLHCALGHSSLCIRRSTLETVGGYEEQTLTNEDYRLFCKLSRQGWIHVIPQFLVHYRYHGQSVTGSRSEECLENDVGMLDGHLRKLTGETWSPGEIRTLVHGIGRGGNVSLGRGLAVLARWEDAWQSDLSLSGDEFCELRARTVRAKHRFLRMNARRQPLRFLRHIGDFLG